MQNFGLLFVESQPQTFIDIFSKRMKKEFARIDCFYIRISIKFE